MACGAIINAMWDLWAKSENKPLWKLLVDLEPEFVVDCIDWRHLSDALTPEEALEILREAQKNKNSREAEMSEVGPKAYCTAGWLGLSDEAILETVRKLQEIGFDAFKLKVGHSHLLSSRFCAADAIIAGVVRTVPFSGLDLKHDEQ